jgi:predicted SnoaL-like aldol condensation-catalyzing enzyme
MTGDLIEKASDFIRGLASCDPDLAARHIDPGKYVEHNPLIPDSIAGLKDHIARLPHEGRLEVIRAFNDGAYVFTQADGVFLGCNTFFDVFRFEDGLIVEHWGFSAEAAPPNWSGHTQTDGPITPLADEDTKTNKALVRDYYEAVHLGGKHDEIPRYVWEGCIRHEPGVADGLTAFLRDLKVVTQNRSIDEIALLLGQNDFVFLVAKGSVENRPCLYVDLYRAENGKIVEHWGFAGEPPPREQRRNANPIV